MKYQKITLSINQFYFVHACLIKIISMIGIEVLDFDQRSDLSVAFSRQKFQSAIGEKA